MGLSIHRGDAERRLVLTAEGSAPLGSDYEPKIRMVVIEKHLTGEK